MPADATIGVSASRIERLIDVLSLLSLGEYDPALQQIEVGGEEGALSVLEQALAIFVQELADASEENHAYVAALEHSKRDIEQKLETIERQRVEIRVLSTPILQIWKDVLALPIVGNVDAQRSAEMTERLLQRIADAQARCVIIDVTGLDEIDTMTASHFMQMIRAARLLGAHCVITGMNPKTSLTMINLGVDLGAVQTLRSLEEGLKHCLQHLQRRQR